VKERGLANLDELHEWMKKTRAAFESAVERAHAAAGGTA
jgi:hypothetical protein